MATAGAETNVPLLVAGVFAATFLVVGAIAYLLLFRQPRPESTETSRPTSRLDEVTAAPPSPAGLEVTPQFALPLDDLEPQPPPMPAELPASMARDLRASAVEDSPADNSQRFFVRLYRALMFATGIAGLLASALMFSSVDGLTLLPFAALLIAVFSVYSIYRGFVPDRELRARPRKK